MFGFLLLASAAAAAAASRTTIGCLRYESATLADEETGGEEISLLLFSICESFAISVVVVVEIDIGEDVTFVVSSVSVMIRLSSWMLKMGTKRIDSYYMNLDNSISQGGRVIIIELLYYKMIWYFQTLFQ